VAVGVLAMSACVCLSVRMFMSVCVFVRSVCMSVILRTACPMGALCARRLASQQPKLTRRTGS